MTCSKCARVTGTISADEWRVPLCDACTDRGIRITGFVRAPDAKHGAQWIIIAFGWFIYLIESGQR